MTRQRSIRWGFEILDVVESNPHTHNIVCIGVSEKLRDLFAEVPEASVFPGVLFAFECWACIPYVISRRNIPKSGGTFVFKIFEAVNSCVPFLFNDSAHSFISSFSGTTQLLGCLLERDVCSILVFLFD